MTSSRRHHQCSSKPRKTTNRCPTSLLCLFLLQASLHAQPISYDCNYYQDTCRLDWQVDGICDDSVVGCQEADCFDCDPCQRWSYACSQCLRQEGCYWCPGDAICLSQKLEGSYWQDKTVTSSCTTQEEWVQTCDAPEDTVFGDAYYTAMQWMYDLIQVEQVWKEGITGKGVKVRVNDDGVDPFHPEFIANFDSTNSCDQKYPSDNNVDVQGSAVASLVGGDANGACSVGIAPNVQISSCNVNQLADAAFVWDQQLPDRADVSINAWNARPCTYLPNNRQTTEEAYCPFDANHFQSPCPVCTVSPVTGALIDTPQCQQAIRDYCTWYYELACVDYLDHFVTCQYHALDAQTQDVLVRNIVTGRQKKGVIFIVPSGDSNQLGGDGNMDGMVHSRFTIAVGAVNRQGLHAEYSTPGAPVLISAPGGDRQSVSNNIVAKPGGGCRDAGFGTAFAVPVVGGVVALMLEVNPELGWRDVQAILVRTAQKVNDGEWTTNAEGFSHSYRYGYGIVHAAAAVEAAKGWTNFPREEQITLESTSDSQAIADDANNATISTLDAGKVNAFFRIESVVVYVDLKHASRGDLKITLTSPGGTESLLVPSKRPENTVSEELWKFTTVRHFWENPGGEWELRIFDEKPVPCNDYYWEYTYTMGEGGATQTMTCGDFAMASSCTNAEEVDPNLLSQEFEGRTPLEACCACGGGDRHQDITNTLKSWKLVVYGHLAGDAESNELVQIPESTCQFSNDTCPEKKQFNHVCDDSLLNEECIGGDCFDCDACQVFTYDCEACVNAGCNYCPGDGICMSVALDESFWDLYPDKSTSCPTSTEWRDTCEKRSEDTFEDPLYDTMRWSYEMIKVEQVWNESFSGKGIHVRINDDGVAQHAEFEGKYDVDSSCSEYLPRDPEKDTHGTAVASIVAGNTNNECAVGIAPGATISSCVGPDSLDDASDLLVSNLDQVQISVNSWGPNICRLNLYDRRRRLQQCMFSTEHPDSPCEACGDFSNVTDACKAAVSKYCSENYEEEEVACAEYFDLWVSCAYHLLPLDAHQSFVKAITEGRGRRGVIFIFSAGNTNDRGEDTNFNGFVNSRFTIAVGAVGKDKKHVSYSTTGAAVFVSAPAGDLDSISGNIVAKPGGGCHDISVGTSFAAPVVAGVIALMLQFKPELSWRDVQGILALESQDFDRKDASWVTNAAGYSHSYKYGFGVVSVHDAMNRARIWKKFDTEKQLMNQTGTINLPFSEETVSSSTLFFPKRLATNFVTESVIVYLDVQHPSRGDILILLTSPGGTDSILHPGNRPENTQLEGGEDDFKMWKLLSLRTWGEFPIGEWKLSIQDKSPGNYGECVDLPWEHSYATEAGRSNETLSCRDFAEVTNCSDVNQANPDILSILYQNRTLLDSCCNCGGGKNSATVVPLLRSWKLVIYGHIIQSPEDLIIHPNSKPSGSEGDGTADTVTAPVNADEDETNADGESSGGSGSGASGWDDRGNSGEFSGGGGTAFWAEGWTGIKEGNAFRGNNGGSDASKTFLPTDALLGCALISLLGIAAHIS